MPGIEQTVAFIFGRALQRLSLCTASQTIQALLTDIEIVQFAESFLNLTDEVRKRLEWAGGSDLRDKLAGVPQAFGGDPQAMELSSVVCLWQESLGKLIDFVHQAASQKRPCVAGLFHIRRRMTDLFRMLGEFSFPKQ